eukprot:CAMPEP_0180028696 /NCGR_PEP_ID=MMETSP0984-20121128/26431_1 /TAXON_ID=483367 /ORGANISM="non described non described, Strain CCMP 2436" /LENGTH=44 /DNA_ID= /DNA_START= /DNA_END= /DNA_ORIENTATION=
MNVGPNGASKPRRRETSCAVRFTGGSRSGAHAAAGGIVLRGADR